ncbi:MAG: helix-turn-helix domain-containing protein [Thermomicrobiales bacterium]
MMIQIPRSGGAMGGRNRLDEPSGQAGGRWLSINEACRFLGVDQSTLRRWSDAGKVPVFRTPGGHRRYLEADLRALLGRSAGQQERPRVSRQALTDRSLMAYEDEYMRAARERRWFKVFSAATQDDYRRLGRRLVDLAVRYALVQAERDRVDYLREGQQIGEHYGRAGGRAGLSAVETVEAFLYFRFPVLRAVLGLIDDEGLAAKHAARVFVEIGHFMDQVLLATVRTHEQHAPFPVHAAGLSDSQSFAVSDV